MGDSWIVDNLNAALNTWNGKLAEIWQLLTESPQTFRGGQVWSVMVGIHGALQAIGYGLLVLFFAIGVVKTCGSFVEVKRPEHALKLFIRFALAKAAVTYGLELMQAVFSIVQGTVSTVITQSGTSGMNSTTLPQELVDAINDVGFWDSIPLWAVTLIGGLLITVLSFVMILTVYGRMFSLWMYAAIAPIPLAAFAGEPTANVGKNFIRSLCRGVLAGLGDRAVVRDLFGAGRQSAERGYLRIGRDCRLDLCGRADVQPVGVGRCDQGLRQDRKRNYGIVRCRYGDQNTKRSPRIPRNDFLWAEHAAVCLLPVSSGCSCCGVLSAAADVGHGRNRLGVYFGRRTVCRLRIFYLPRHDAGATAVGMVQIRTAVPQTAGVPLG